MSANQDKNRPDGRFRAVFDFYVMETSKKTEVLDFIRAHPGCTSTAVADELYGKQLWSGWIFARRDIDALCNEGLVEERFDSGISTFYATEQQEEVV